MKKFFEKHDLIKISGIMVLVSVLLTWIIPYGYFSGSDIVIEDITRVGLTNFMQYGLLGLYYFTVLVTFLFVLGAFYQMLGKTAGYRKLIKDISDKFKGHEVLVSLIVSFVFAAVTSVSYEYLPIVVFIPFVVTVLSNIKVDKVSALAATFGSMLVGIIGSTYSTKIAGYISSSLNTEVTSLLVVKIALFVLAFAFLNVFNIRRIKKVKKDAKQEYDMFAIETFEKKTTAKSWPYIVLGVVMFVVTVLAYLPWSTWEVTLFDTVTKSVNEFTILGVPVLSYVLGNLLAFGAWDLFTIQFVMLFAILLIHWFGRVNLDETIEAFGNGFAKMAPTVVVLLFVYMILEFSVMYPVVPVIVDWFATIAKGFNVVWNFIAAFITSLFSVEMQYAMNLAGSYYAANFAGSTEVMSLIFQTTFGLVSFFAPSSVILMIGLSYLKVPYKDWFKFIWKFLVAMLLVSIILIIIVA